MKALVTGRKELECHFSLSMILFLGQNKIHCSTQQDPSPSMDNDPLVLSRYSGGFIPNPDAPKKIESFDWPAPIALQAVPELQRLTTDEHRIEDEQILKLKDTSGMAHDLFEDYRQYCPTISLNPWKASRSPSAAIEPSRRCRFDSPKFASPSRRVHTHSSSMTNPDQSLSNISQTTTKPTKTDESIVCLATMEMERSCDLPSTSRSYGKDSLINQEKISFLFLFRSN